MPEMMGSKLMDPPVPVTLTAVPFPVAASMLLSDSASLAVLVGESVAVKTASTPLLMAFVFIPLARQVMEPVPELQLSVLPAAVSADPAAAVRELMPVAG